MKKLILFIHGLGGSAEGTWRQFPKLMREDADLVGQYDVKTFEYPTGIVGSKPSLAACATILKTEIENRHPSYSDIALIAHSQGGLVARHFIAERINSKQPLLVSRLLTFATPHQGSGFATLLKWAPFTSQQTEDLDPNSEFMRALGVAWGQAKADTRVLTKYVVAAGDAIVGQVSAIGSWSPGHDVVGGNGHLAVVKPETAGHMSFLIAKKFLLEDSLQPGGVEADYTAPLLSFPFVPCEELTRFTFSARALPFIGREAEERILTDFLDGSDQMFRWMVMHGSGGVGKSRLALELCLAVRNEWHAGFLQDEEADPVWGKWQPLMPTLIVIDPAARDTVRTGKVLRALAGRGPAYGTARLAAPVRILLVERAGEGEWLKKILAGDETKKKQLDLARSPDLPLTTISDPWPIFEFALKQAGKQSPDREKMLAALAEIDSERRPLFAYFLADAIARGVDIRHFDAARLLEEIIEHGRESYWKPAGATDADERLLAVATMAGGLPVSAVKDLKDDLLPAWNIDHHPKVFRAMTGRKSGQDIAPLAPDIVGEHFALACLGQEELPNPDEDRARFCEHAWRLNPLGMAQFMLRSHHDLPTHPMLHWVRKLPASEGEAQVAWSWAAVDLMRDLRSVDPDAARGLLDEMRSVAEARNEALLWEAWAMAAAAKFGGDLGSLLQNSVLAGPIQEKSSAKKIFFYENPLVTGDPVMARTLLDKIRDVAAARDETALWKTWTYAGLSLMDELASSDPIAAWALLADIFGVMAAKHDADFFMWQPMVMNIVNAAAPSWLSKMRDVAAARDEAPLWEQWAKAAYDFVQFRSLDPVAARALLDDVRSAADQRQEAPLWEQWARGAHNLMNDLVSSNPVAAQALLNDMRGVADQRNEASLWEWWASAASKLTNGLGSCDTVAARALLDDLCGVAAARDEALLWEQWARSAHNMVIDLRSVDTDAARALLNDMRSVAATRDEAAPWDLWAKAAIASLTNDLRSRDLSAARALLEDVRDVAAARDEALLWEQWARGAFNVVIDLLSRDPVAVLALLNDMRGVAATRDETALWDLWAKAAIATLTDDLQSRDPAAARALLDDVRGVAAARGETLLWEPWAGAAFSLTDDLRSHDPVAARTLLDEMRDVAETNDEAALWEWWAKAAVNMTIGSLANDESRDPIAARALLDHMRDVAKARDDALLWEMWAMAAVNVTDDLLSRDPVAARALLDDMRDAAVTRDNSSLWEQWARAAHNSVNDLRSRDAVEARTVLNHMGGVAEARDEAQLWELWARASFTLILELGSRDPAAVRALVGDMLKAVARHPGDVGGWQTKVVGLVLHVAFTLTEDLATRDPAAARTFCAEVLGLPEEILQKMQFGG